MQRPAATHSAVTLAAPLNDAMPGPALPFLLATIVYARWERTPVAAPFEPCPAVRSAFLHGSLGPDMGYFPGADPMLAELAHHARTGMFCRALVHEAETDLARAFAWGWVTHVLADVAVHPLVNDACGELLLGRRTPLWGPDVATAHLRVETGSNRAVQDATGIAYHTIRRLRTGEQTNARGETLRRMQAYLAARNEQPA